MKKQTLLFLILIACYAQSFAAEAKADYTIGPLYAEGLHADEATAYAAAITLMDDAVEAIEASLPPGEELVGTVIYDLNYDGFTYTITFHVLVLEL